MKNKVFAERLFSLQGSSSDVAFSKACGIPNATMAMYRKGSLPSVDKAYVIAKNLNVSLDWLTGVVDNKVTNNDESIRNIPRYDLSASAGNGAVVLAQAPDGELHIDENIIQSYAPKNARLGVIDIVGDSMWPTLIDGDLVIVNFNSSRRDLIGGGIFVFSKDQDLFVKRMILSPDGIITASSDNLKYPTISFNTANEAEDVIIHGKVIWVGGHPRPANLNSANGA